MMPASESTPTLSSWLVFNPNWDTQHGTAPLMHSGRGATVAERLRELAPYAALLALPGGSMLTLLLWLYRRQKKSARVLEADPNDCPTISILSGDESRFLPLR